MIVFLTHIGRYDTGKSPLLAHNVYEKSYAVGYVDGADTAERHHYAVAVAFACAERALIATNIRFAHFLLRHIFRDTLTVKLLVVEAHMFRPYDSAHRHSGFNLFGAYAVGKHRIFGHIFRVTSVVCVSVLI